MLNCELDRSPIASKAGKRELWVSLPPRVWIACNRLLDGIAAILITGMDRATRGRVQSLFLYVRVTV
jgi:hypothetical protein